jgi:hypothetical protein
MAAAQKSGMMTNYTLRQSISRQIRKAHESYQDNVFGPEDRRHRQDLSLRPASAHRCAPLKSPGNLPIRELHLKPDIQEPVPVLTDGLPVVL